MANLVQKNNPPAPEHNNSKYTKIGILLLVAALIGFVVFGYYHSYIALIVGGGCLFAGMIAFLANLTLPSYTPAGKRYGNAGEKKVGSILEHYLPDNYTIIQNCKVTFEGKSSEIDNIVVGKSGVFIVEVKNMKGHIIGDYNQKQWMQYKVDQYNIAHTKTFYNPVKQVGTHIYRLANYLRDNRIFTHISGAIYFANEKTSLSLGGEAKDIPVFTYSSTPELLDYITGGTANLSDKTVESIIQLLQRI